MTVFQVLLAQSKQFGTGKNTGGGSNSLGTLQPPSDAFAPASNTGDAAASVLENIISMALGAITILAGMYFILVFLIAGFNWLSASGDSGKVKKARDSMIQALIGLIIIVASYSVIGLIGSIVGIDLLNPGQLLLNLVPGGSP